MFIPAANQKIWLCTTPVDMRKSFNGLSALVRNKLCHNPQSGQYFVFINARKTQMKVLYFDSFSPVMNTTVVIVPLAVRLTTSGKTHSHGGLLS